MTYENVLLFWHRQILLSFCFDAVLSTKISSCEPVWSQKYENGYRPKMCDVTVFGLWHPIIPRPRFVIY